MALYLGLDSSTQGLTAIVIEVGPRARRVVHCDAINFDAELPHYGTHHGTNSCADPSLVTAPPTMWAEALDRMMARLAGSGVDWTGAGGHFRFRPAARKRLSERTCQRLAAGTRSTRGPVAPGERHAVARRVADLDGLEHDQAVRGNHGVSWRRRYSRRAHRLARLRTLHGSADSQVLAAGSGALRCHRSDSSRELVHGLPSRRHSCAARSG